MLSALALASALILAPQPAAGSVVEIAREGGGWQLIRNGEPYTIRGAGGALGGRIHDLVAAGGNSTRTWGAENLREQLDEAHALGVSVTIGIWLRHSDGFDYTDPVATQEQYERAIAAVKEYKDHPALLMWAVGNEMELGGSAWPEVFQHVEKIAAEIKRRDPHHPVMTVVADMWEDKMDMLLEHCPSIDVLGVNSYAGLPTLEQRMSRWRKPYVITEWAFPTPGQAPVTPWGSPYEWTSHEKAQQVIANYRHISGRPGQILGSYAFLWASNENAGLAPWYDVFIRSGEPTAVRDALQFLWTGSYPERRAPHIDRLEPEWAPHPRPGATVTVRIPARSRGGGQLAYRFELRSDDYERRFSTDIEMADRLWAEGEVAQEFTVTLPTEPGPYRLTVVAICDASGAAATANVPFLIER